MIFKEIWNTFYYPCKILEIVALKKIGNKVTCNNGILFEGYVDSKFISLRSYDIFVLFQKVEQEHDANTVILYLNGLNEISSCVLIEAFRSEIVMNIQSSFVELHDYYNNSL